MHHKASLRVSGSGKTLAIQAIHRLMYEIMGELTGIPIDQLPHAYFAFARVRCSRCGWANPTRTWTGYSMS